MSSICIIIPCYNEANRLPVLEFEKFISENNIHFCFVNDGSRDATIEVLNTLRNRFVDKITIIDLAQNKGKANAVRQGVLTMKNRYDYVGYFDADLATPLNEVYNLLTEFERNATLKLVFGSRILTLNSTIQRKAYRHYFGRIIATCISLILQLPIYDTQCGAKLFRNEVIATCFEQDFVSRWLFDVEIFKRLKAEYQSETKNMIKELPLQKWTDVDESKITLWDMAKVPLELLKIYAK